MLTLPVVGRSSPARRPSSVVLPEPDAPTIARLAPRSTSRLTPSSIVKRPSGPSTVLLTSRVLNTISDAEDMMIGRLLALLLLMWNAVAVAAPRPLLVLGDSLSSAHHIAVETGWVHL